MKYWLKLITRRPLLLFFEAKNLLAFKKKITKVVAATYSKKKREEKIRN